MSGGRTLIGCTLHLFPHMTHPGSASLSDLRASLLTERKAWAAWRDQTAETRSAAVMGSLLSHQSVYSDEWTPSDSVDSDTALTWEIQKCAAVAPMLRQRVEEHLAWIAEWQEAKVSERLASEYPTLTLLGDPQAQAIQEMRLDEEHGRIRDNIEAKIVAIEAELESLTNSKSRGI